jgi:triacylglycerol lipase
MRFLAATTVAVFGVAIASCGGGETTAASFAPVDGQAGGSGGSAGGAGRGGTSAGMAGTTSFAGSGGASGAAGGAGAGGKPLGPPYPIVLCHGFFGFEKFAGVDFVTYFYGVKDHLAQQDGEVLVFTPAVDPFNSSVIRGAQLTAKVQEILKQTGYPKVNLVAHSQGGLDARVVAHDHPEMVASVTTIATPHFGTPVADVVLKLVADPNAQLVIDGLVQAVGSALYDTTGKTTSLAKSLQQMSSDGIATFNASYPNVQGIPYFSLTGRSSGSNGKPECQVPDAPGFIAKYDSVNDPINALLSPTGSLLSGDGPTPAPNDGLVRAKDAKWGKFLGCIPGDHFDEIGQILGAGPGLGNTFQYLPMYSDLVKYLRAQGL